MQIQKCENFQTCAFDQVCTMEKSILNHNTKVHWNHATKVSTSKLIENFVNELVITKSHVPCLQFEGSCEISSSYLHFSNSKLFV